MSDKDKEKDSNIATAACNLGVAVGVLLALERHGKHPFDGRRGCTYGDFKELLKREYLVEIEAHDFEAIIDLFNGHPKTEVWLENTGVSAHHAEADPGKAN